MIKDYIFRKRGEMRQRETAVTMLLEGAMKKGVGYEQVLLPHLVGPVQSFSFSPS